MNKPLKINKLQAMYVYFLRCRCEGSWRWVADKYNERYISKLPFSDSITEGANQIYGMKLCSEASKVLKINVD